MARDLARLARAGLLWTGAQRPELRRDREARAAVLLRHRSRCRLRAVTPDGPAIGDIQADAGDTVLRCRYLPGRQADAREALRVEAEHCHPGGAWVEVDDGRALTWTRK